ncbi:MAG: tetratricopeptide repeat protein [Elusimicrobiota bacterium]
MNRSFAALAGLAFAGLLASGCGDTGASRAEQDSQDQVYRRLFDEPLERFFVRETAEDGSALYAARRSGASALSRFPAVKAPRVRRVFIIGGSSAQHFDKGHLYGMLRRALPGLDFEIVDCSLRYHDSSRDLLLVREVLEYAPDLLILMSGSDEGMPAAAAGPIGGARALASLLRAALKLRAPAAARLLLRESRAAEPSRVEHWFEGEMRAMVRAAKLRGVPVLLCTLPWDFKDTPPAGALPLGKRAFFEAWFQFERGDTAASARLFGAHLKALAGRRTRERAFTEYYLGRSLEEEGDLPAAREHYLRVSELEIPPMAALNAVVRRLGREEGIPFADLEKHFLEVRPDGIPGSDSFDDEFRWTRDWDAGVAGVLARAMAAASRERTFLAPGKDWDIAGLEAMIRVPPRPLKGGVDRTAEWTGLMLRLWEIDAAGDGRPRERLVSAMCRLLAWRPDVFAKSDGVQRWLVERLIAETDAEGVERRVRKWMPVMLAHLAEASLRRGEFGRSIRYFDEFLRLDAAIPRLRLRKCVALYGMGKKREALQGLEELRGVEEILPEVGFYREKFQQGVWPRIAKKAKKRPAAPAKESEEALLRKSLGPAGAAAKLLARGKRDAARRMVAEALGRKPAEAAAEEWLRLAAVAKDAGWSEDALSALEKARDAGCGADMAARLSMEYASLGDPAAVLPLIRSLAARPPKGGTPMAWLHLASVAFARGDRASGIKALAAAEAAGPDGRMSAEIARSYAHAGELRRAGPMVRRAARLGSASFSGLDWLGLAHIARDAGDKAAGVKALERAQKAGGVPGLDAAKAYSALKEPRLAAKALKPVLEAEPGSMTAAGYLEAAHVAVAAGDRGLAREALALASAADSGGALKQEIARSYVGLGLFKDAAPNIRAITGSLSAKDWLDLARSAHGGGDLEAAGEALAHAVAERPEPAVQAGCARLYAEIDKPEQALAMARSLVAAGSAALSSEGWADVAFAASRSGDRETALKALASSEASMASPEEKRAVAVRCQELKEYGRALAILDALISAEPRSAGLLSDRGVLQALMGRVPAAIDDLRRAVDIDPGNLGAVLTLGGLLTEDQALSLYDKALKQESAKGSPARPLVQQERDRLAVKRRAP